MQIYDMFFWDLTNETTRCLSAEKDITKKTRQIINSEPYQPQKTYYGWVEVGNKIIRYTVYNGFMLSVDAYILSIVDELDKQEISSDKSIQHQTFDYESSKYNDAWFICKWAKVEPREIKSKFKEDTWTHS